jgi:hypothetical protein
MVNNTCSELNIRLSIFRFLQQIADQYNLTLFANDPPTQDDENQMDELAKYLFVRFTPDDGPQTPNCLLHQLVTFYLYSRKQVLEPITEHNDEPMLWLREMVRRLKWDIQHTTTAFNLIAIYDYERLTTIGDFRQTGDYTKIQAAITGSPALIPGTGFYVTLGSGPQFFFQEEPRRGTWSMRFRHFAPENMVWGPSG